MDPGHNGANGSHPAETSRLVDAGGFQKRCNTTGTSASGVTESEVKWQVANRLTVMLEAAGATVVVGEPYGVMEAADLCLTSSGRPGPRSMTLTTA